MKKTLSAILYILLLVTPAAARVSDSEAFEQWKDDKYSMFIHFGLYSVLGGVWDGKPVLDGYSEQIQSFAGIFSDWYASTADEFDPVNFDADEIAVLAKKAGMRSIIFTTKHHDGFSMFDTKTSDYTSVAATPSRRDFVKEMAEACERNGLKFGLYFSLIDWHFPYAYPISSHNADFVTPQHHELNKAQVRELLTGYGPISELWFDMGSLRPEQSRELFDLVKELQPDCMVSGRLGNDMYDFAVMADNKLPETALHAPWQSAASMFAETWSYRSWQERGEVADKVAEKLRSLIDVVSRGGNYLLNIGPMGDGAVVPFERDVLLEVGEWLERNGEYIYATEASPFRNEFAWGKVTRKGNRLHLFLSGSYPEDGKIVLPVNGYRLKKGINAVCRQNKGECIVDVTKEQYEDKADVQVVVLEFDKVVEPFHSYEVLPYGQLLSSENASADYSYSCFDYYSNYRSTVAYNWMVEGTGKMKEVMLAYTADEVGRVVNLEVDGRNYEVILDDADRYTVAEKGEIEVAEVSFGRLRGGVFDNWHNWGAYDFSALPASENEVSLEVRPFSNYLMYTEFEVPYDGLYVFGYTAGNGAELVLDGKQVAKHLNPYGEKCRKQQLLLNLTAGRHSLAVRAYNRFEKELTVSLKPADEAALYRKKVVLQETVSSKVHNIRISAADMLSGHTDCGLNNVKIFVSMK